MPCSVRFTPTHVGNTAPPDPVCQGDPVHPHARGEHARVVWQLVRDLGSPPRTWGTLARRLAKAVGARFTPTHVGNTIWSAPPSSPATVHPHARGEHAAPV